jgi:DNA-binding XRE family transcriptional regulator
MTIIDNDNPSNPSNPTDTTQPTDTTKSTESTNSSDPSKPSSSTELPKLGDSIEYTPESELNDLDYADVEYPDIKQLRKEIRVANTIIGCKLKEIRLSARFTRRELAIILGVSEGRIERYENGEQGITLAELFKACKELGADVWYFFMGG